MRVVRLIVFSSLRDLLLRFFGCRGLLRKLGHATFFTGSDLLQRQSVLYLSGIWLVFVPLDLFIIVFFKAIVIVSTAAPAKRLVFSQIAMRSYIDLEWRQLLLLRRDESLAGARFDAILFGLLYDFWRFAIRDGRVASLAGNFGRARQV